MAAGQLGCKGEERELDNPSCCAGLVKSSKLFLSCCCCKSLLCLRGVAQHCAGLCSLPVLVLHVPEAAFFAASVGASWSSVRG